jgi:hypothetical protein
MPLMMSPLNNNERPSAHQRIKMRAVDFQLPGV